MVRRCGASRSGIQGVTTMARYEGMDKVLQGVRDRLSARPDSVQRDTTNPRKATVSRDDPYANAVEGVMLLLRDAQKLRDLLAPSQVGAVTADQREEIRSLLVRVVVELSSHLDALEQVAQYEGRSS